MPQRNQTLDLGQVADSIRLLFRSPHASLEHKIGLELEFLPLVEKNNTFIVTDYSNAENRGVLDIIQADVATSDYFKAEKNAEGATLFTNTDGGNITFEPSSQVEYSSSPQPIKTAITEVAKNVSHIFNLFSKYDINLFCGAINPWHTPEEVGLKLTKDRYIHMNNYYNSVNEYGQKMMRMTTALQISFDVGSEEETTQRWVAGNLLTPILTAIFGNSPFAERVNTQVKSFRTKIWNNLDKSRTGIILGETVPTSLIEIEALYRSFALNANVMRLPDQDGNLIFQANNIKFIDWLENGYNGFYPDQNDWETHLTTLFPAIRPKGFFEFRGIDGQTRSWWAVPAILLFRILYDTDVSQKVIDLLSPYIDQIQDMQWKASISGVSAFPELCHKIFKLALEESKASIEESLLDHLKRFYAHYTLKGMNPADELLFFNNGDLLSVNQYKCYESSLLKMAAPPEYASFPTIIDIDDKQYQKCLEHYKTQKNI